jgi:hypothetical protein
MFQAGLSAQEPTFQAAVVRVQLALEDACTLGAKSGAVLVCHRGALDPLAYWLAAGREEENFFSCMGFGRAELLERYAGILHLQSTAIGAEQFYRRWPDAHRPETTVQSAEIDHLCLRAWQGHRRHVVIENREGGWRRKAQRVRQMLETWLEESEEPSLERSAGDGQCGGT